MSIFPPEYFQARTVWPPGWAVDCEWEIANWVEQLGVSVPREKGQIMQGRLNVFIYSIGFDQSQTERGDELAGLMVRRYFSVS